MAGTGCLLENQYCTDTVEVSRRQALCDAVGHQQEPRAEQVPESPGLRGHTSHEMQGKQINDLTVATARADM